MLESSNVFLIGFRVKDSQRTVTAIRLCAYPPEEIDAVVNQWASFLEVEGGKSVLLNMSPGSNLVTRKGVLMVSSEDRVDSSEVVHVEHFPLIGDALTVENIIDGIIERKRDSYRFTGEETGCRHWQYVFLKELEQEGRLSEGSAEAGLESMEKFYGNDGKVIGHKVVEQGVFCDLE